MQDPVALLTTVAFVATVGAAGILDLRTRRIPNRLTVGSLLLALVLSAVAGLGALSDSLMGAGLGRVGNARANHIHGNPMTGYFQS